MREKVAGEYFFFFALWSMDGWGPGGLAWARPHVSCFMCACVRCMFLGRGLEKGKRGANAGLDLQRCLERCCLAAEKGLGGERSLISWGGKIMIGSLSQWV